MGDSLVDGENPFSPGAKSIGSDGSVTEGGPAASGYSVIMADSMDDAVEKTKGCPVLQGGASLTVYKTVALPLSYVGRYCKRPQTTTWPLF